MKFRTIVGLLIVLHIGSCIQRTSNGGLLIDNGPSHGVNYTDTLGTKYSLRYIPITITNDCTISIHLQIAISNEFDYPVAYGDMKYKVFLFPKELTPDKVTFDTLSYELGNNELRNLLDTGFDSPYILNKTLERHEKCVITIGTLYPNPTNCGVVPNALFLQNNRGLYHTCDSLMNQDKSTDPQLTLGLKLDFCESCILIPCGQVSYSDH